MSIRIPLEKESHSMKPALIIGSTCVDVIINLDHLPRTAENLRPHSQSMALGGCAYNVAHIMGLRSEERRVGKEC